MSIHFPDNIEFLADFILQRTDAFIKIGGSKLLNNWAKGGSKIELANYLINNKKVLLFLQLTTNHITNEVDELVSFASLKKINKLVSIGPGNGILELLLYRKCYFKKILLIDIEKTDSQRHNFNKDGSGYASLINTKKFLINNEVPENCIITCNPKFETLPKFNFDVLISFFSMGFHYPCNDYCDFIETNSNKNSKIIFDKRISSEDYGYFKLKNYFKKINKIIKPKYNRILLRHN